MPTLKDLHITPVTMDSDIDAKNKQISSDNDTKLKSNDIFNDNIIKFGDKNQIENVIDSKTLKGYKDLSKLNKSDLEISQYDVTEDKLKKGKTSTDNLIKKNENVINTIDITGRKKIKTMNVNESSNPTGRKTLTDSNLNYPNK